MSGANRNRRLGRLLLCFRPATAHCWEMCSGGTSGPRFLHNPAINVKLLVLRCKANDSSLDGRSDHDFAVNPAIRSTMSRAHVHNFACRLGWCVNLNFLGNPAINVKSAVLKCKTVWAFYGGGVTGIFWVDPRLKVH